MPSGEDVEIAEPADCLPVLVALFLVTPRALTFLLFFTRLPSSFKNVAGANRRQNTSYLLSTPPWIAALDRFPRDRNGRTGVRLCAGPIWERRGPATGIRPSLRAGWHLIRYVSGDEFSFFNGLLI